MHSREAGHVKSNNLTNIARRLETVRDRM